MHAKRWTIAEPHPAAAELAERLRTSPLLAQILLNRGLTEFEECRTFLSPSLKMLHDPARMPNLTRAAERVARAIRNREKIVIYGDYDVDGITATSILWHAITLLGGVVDYYIPHRIDEGYGLNADAIAQICREGAKVIVTVDCGVTAVEPARVAAEAGVDLIITDHHEFHLQDGEARLPDCYCVVHPRLPSNGQAYPNPHICGAGVAFKLAWGLGQQMYGARVSSEFRDYLLEATALAALGTIADVVPLVDENRILAHFGLGGLKATKLTGLRALIASANLTGQKIDSYHVGFRLAPRLNACGRLGHARLAVEMLTRADSAKALEIATYLEQQNRARQTLERKILEQAKAQIQELNLIEDDCRGLVLGMEGWHAGVIGIVASRIVDQYHRPTVMIALNDGMGQGSARSINGFHLARALEQCSDYLEGHGGHEMAAGLKLSAAKFEDFRHAFSEYAARNVTDEMLQPEMRLEALAELRQINAALVADLKRLGPFGQGNRKPLLACRNLELVAPPRRVGKSGDHLQMLVRQGNNQMKCIAFNFAKLYDHLKPGMRIDLAVEPTLNEFNGYSTVELEVKDIQFPGN